MIHQINNQLLGMKELKEKGTTILFVTHSLDSVVKICSRAIVLSEGFLIFDGTSKDAVDFFKMKHMTKNIDKSNFEQNIKTIKSLKKSARKNKFV